MPAFVLENAKYLSADGPSWQNGTIVLRDGRIASIGARSDAPADALRVDLKGLTLIPGLIDAGSATLINPEFDLPQVQPRSGDLSKTALAISPIDNHSSLTPQFRAAEALWTDDTHLQPFRQAGFTSVHVIPESRVASGLSAVLQLSGHPPREALEPVTPMSSLRIWERRGTEYPSTMMGIFAHLRQHFLDAEWTGHATSNSPGANASGPRPTIPGDLVSDAILDAFRDLRRGASRAVFAVETKDDVARALNLSKEFQLKPVLWGPHELPVSLDRLKDSQAAVILTLDFGTEPKAEKEDEQTSDFVKLADDPAILKWKQQRWKTRLLLAERLEEAGIPWAYATKGLKSPDDVWSSMRQLKKAGLSEALILSGLTRNSADLLGLVDLGRIAVGQRAHLVALTGPPMHEQVKVRHVFVAGLHYEYHRDAEQIVESQIAPETGSSVTGHWDVIIDAGEPKFAAQFEFETAATGLAGRFVSSQGNGRITQGRVRGDRIEIEVSIGAGDGVVPLKFEGEFSENKMQGTLKSPFGPAVPFQATRQPEVAAPVSAIQFGILEDLASPQAAAPVSALDATASKTIPDAQPVRSRWEFPESRVARPLPTAGHVLIRNGTLLTGTGETLKDTSILVKNGIITAIGPQLQADGEISVIDATGRFVMPGIIDTHSHIMISNGLGGVNEATNSIVCEVRVEDVLNTADPREYRALAGGVTTVRLLHGSANVIGGQDAIVQLKHGETPEDHLLPNSPRGVKFALGENVKFRSGRFPNTRLGVEATLQRAFVEALEYRRQWRDYERQHKRKPKNSQAAVAPRRDLRLEALMKILDQEMFIHSHCYRADEILMLLRVAESHGIRVRSLQHVLEGYKVAPEIVAHGASCSTFADWWNYKVEAADAVPQNATLLHEAGANSVLKSDDAELMRHMFQEAAKSVRYGNLSPDVALSLITLHPARELGIDDRLGSLEVGKQADLAIFNAHPLNTFARCEMTLIAGVPCFVRDQQPTAMSPAAEAASQNPPELNLVPRQERRPWIDWSAVTASQFALVGGTLHPVDRPSINGGTLLCENGRIVQLGEQVHIPDDCPQIDVTGLHVYPGLIDAGTTLGLTEIGKVKETHDNDEIGLFQPDLRAGVAINPDSDLIPVTRAGGITTIFSRPTGGVMSGQGSIVQLAGWTAPEMGLVLEAGLVIHWPGAFDWPERVRHLRDWLEAARAYDRARSRGTKNAAALPLTDPRYEALRPYVRGERPIFVEADTRQHLSEVLKFAELESVKVVLCGAADAWKIADQIQAANVPVIVGQTMRGPVSAFDPFDATYANAGRLHEAGVKFCIRSNNATNSRNAPFEAGMAVAYGLPEAAGLRSVTLSAAEILGIADITGSLTPGKRADLVILDGSPLQVTSQVKGVVIAGQPFRPESKQTRLVEKYRQRLTKADQ